MLTGIVRDDVPDDDPDDDADGARVPSAADLALVDRLEVAAIQYERRVFGRFGHQGTARQWAEDMAEPLVASELAVAGGLSPTTARAWVDAAVALFVEDRLPGLARLLEAGWVDWAKANLFVRETSHLDPQVARAVDAVVLGQVGEDAAALLALDVLDVLADPADPGSGVPVIARWTLPQLKDAIRAAIVEIDEAQAKRREERARRRRHVRVEEDVDGTAEFVANLPAEAAAAVFTSLTQAAKAAKAAGDPRTLDQLRADELVHRATRGVTPTEYQAAAESADPGAPSDAHSAADSSPDFAADADADQSTDFDAAGPTPEQERCLPADTARCACGRAVPVAFVPSFTAAFAGTPTKSTLVSLTMPLSTFLGLADQPGRLDGYGPVAAALARRIAADAAKEQPTFTAWRCIVTDDVHGTVLGVTDPIWTPRHDPPPRLTRLVTAMEPVCVFPGCRQPARHCDLDHRIPYHPHDPAGEHGGGRTCSCNLQALCRNHHRQKTAGYLKVRAISSSRGPGRPRGHPGMDPALRVTCRSHPHIADPGPHPHQRPRRAPRRRRRRRTPRRSAHSGHVTRPTPPAIRTGRTRPTRSTPPTGPATPGADPATEAAQARADQPNKPHATPNAKPRWTYPHPSDWAGLYVAPSLLAG